MFASTPTMSSVQVALAIAVQNDWPLYDFEFKEAFVQANLDTDGYIKLQYGLGEGTGKVVKLDRALDRINQAGRQWPAFLCQTLVDEYGMEHGHGMEQCRANPCVYRKIVEGVVEMLLIVHVNNILVSGKEVCDEIHYTLKYDNFPTENLWELKWYLECAVERDSTGQCNDQTASNDIFPHQAFQCDRTV